MGKKTIVLLFILLSAPLILLCVLDGVLRRADEEEAAGRFQKTVELRLDVVGAAVNGIIHSQRDRLMNITDIQDISPKNLREVARKEPIVRQMYAVDAQGRLLFPKPGGDISEDERAFLFRTQRIFNGKERFGRDSDSGAPVGIFGWYPWYWEEGLQLLFWRATRNGIIVGGELNRAALLSDIIGDLPERIPDETALKDAAIFFKDENKRVLHVIGGYEPAKSEEPRAELLLEAPLSAMSLCCYVSPQAAAAAMKARNNQMLRLSLVAFGIILLSSAWMLYRESRREISDAENKVTFVNQVSHELKTPLTNIRMYAELLDLELEEEEEKARSYAGVITAESERLSRLILNVLTFGKKQKQSLSISRAPCVIDDVISSVLERLRPGLVARNFEITLDLNTPETVSADKDAVAQILFNLIGNAEKYAASGKFLSIVSRNTADRISILVQDRGKGIAPKFYEKVFEPFYRISSAVEEGVSGTGIGLSISRDLARLHGGDLRIVPNKTGATFEVVISGC